MNSIVFNSFGRFRTAAHIGASFHTFITPPILSSLFHPCVRPVTYRQWSTHLHPTRIQSLQFSSSAMRSHLFSTSSKNPSGEDILASFGEEKSKLFHGNNVGAAMHALANADAVCFDVDSTVIQEEGIDVLAASLGKGEEVAAWTRKAMEGNIKFEDALAARLSILQPSQKDIVHCLTHHPFRLSPGIDRLVDTLNQHGIDVYLVSGGFRIMIEPVAKTLCISKDNIVANTILFDDHGRYLGFDRSEPTSADMGKPKAVKQIKDNFGYDTVVMVGDGATDAQAKPPADAFIGFGGVIVREAVKSKACWYVMDFDEMIEVLHKYGKKKLL